MLRCVQTQICVTWLTGWRRCVGCLKLHVSFRQRTTNYKALLRKMSYRANDYRVLLRKIPYRATNYRALLRKISYTDKPSYVSLLICIHMCDVEHVKLVWSCATHHLWGMTHDIHLCDMAYSYVRRDSFICVTWLIHMCDMTHSYVRHDSFICATW